MLLAASTIDGSGEWTVEAPNRQAANTGVAAEYTRGLYTTECLDLILSLPTRRTKIFSFSFNYDMTMMLRDLPDKALYELFRPDILYRRPKKTDKGESFKGADPIVWEDYELNLQGTKFTVMRRSDEKKVVIWDLFKFYQGKFVAAIDDWKVGDEDTRGFIRLMKDKREDFDKLPPAEVRRYCLQETRYIGDLAQKLVVAAKSADLKLKSFYGAGSLGAAMLDAMGIRDKLAPSPKEMFEAIAAAFAGGRFENSGIGPFREALASWDISSAYVYQLAFLPCLKHASWRHTTKREEIEGATVSANGALVHYTLGTPTHARNVHGEDRVPLGAWGPFPFRSKDGSIAFPIESGGGWVWLDEYLAGEKIFPHVQFREAWVYERNCDCRPFERIPEYYNLRLRIGKEGPGIVIKLGMNSCFVAGTMVLTEKGARPIETIRDGDVVVTREGMRRVTDSGLQGESEATWEVSFTDGTRLEGTPDHHVLTAHDQGAWRPLERLRPGDIILAYEGTRRVATVLPKGRKMPVYGITVEGDAPEFFANGIVAHNCYGKLAQTLGAALFNNWIWAGMITSGCRAQLLEMLWLHHDPQNLLMLATDGVLTREDPCLPVKGNVIVCLRGTKGCPQGHTFVPPLPLDTKTGSTGKPLGGWEHKSVPKGVFMARPGIYFPLDMIDNESDCKGAKCGECKVCFMAAVRARGVGRSVLLKHSRIIVDAWESGGVTAIAKMPDVTRFCGAKTSISISGTPEQRRTGEGAVYTRAKGTGHEPAYGQWVSRPVEMSFNPLPKRERVNPDGRTLQLRRFPADQESMPYPKALRKKGEGMDAGGSDLSPDDVISADTAMMRRAEQEALEQPDSDLTEFEPEMAD